MFFCSFLVYVQRDDKGFAHPERVEKLVKNYSQFVSFPIYTWQEKGFTKEVFFLQINLRLFLSTAMNYAWGSNF